MTSLKIYKPASLSNPAAEPETCRVLDETNIPINKPKVFVSFLSSSKMSNSLSPETENARSQDTISSESVKLSMFKKSITFEAKNRLSSEALKNRDLLSSWFENLDDHNGLLYHSNSVMSMNNCNTDTISHVSNAEESQFLLHGDSYTQNCQYQSNHLSQHSSNQASSYRSNINQLNHIDISSNKSYESEMVNTMSSLRSVNTSSRKIKLIANFADLKSYRNSDFEEKVSQENIDNQKTFINSPHKTKYSASENYLKLSESIVNYASNQFFTWLSDILFGASCDTPLQKSEASYNKKNKSSDVRSNVSKKISAYPANKAQCKSIYNQQLRKVTCVAKKSSVPELSQKTSSTVETTRKVPYLAPKPTYVKKMTLLTGTHKHIIGKFSVQSHAPNTSKIVSAEDVSNQVFKFPNTTIKQKPHVPRIDLAKVSAVKLYLEQQEASNMKNNRARVHQSSAEKRKIMELIAESTIFQKKFSKEFWREEEIKPIKEKMPKSTLWQQLWHLTDPSTKQVLEERHQNKVSRAGYPVITRQKRNTKLYDAGEWSWNNVFLSHIELTIFSVENVPYIAQIIIDTDNSRFWVPFNCYFLRIPYTHDDQIIHLWLTSPVGQSQRCKRDPIIGSIEGRNDWVGATDIETTSNTNYKFANCDEDSFSEHQLQMVVEKVIHPNSVAFKTLPPGQYTPAHEFLTYFKFDIPVKALINCGGTVEAAAALDPRGQFYACNTENSPEENFHLLCEAGEYSEREPLIKFCATLYKQGIAQLVCTKSTKTNDTSSICKYVEKTIYVAQKDDLIDYYVAAQLNENDQELFNKFENPSNVIKRLYHGKYLIHDMEVIIFASFISVTNEPNFDLSKYPEIHSQIYAKGFTLPLVCCDNVFQPLKEFLLINKYTSVETKVLQVEQTRVNQKLIDSWSRQRIELCLLNSIEFPFTRPAVDLTRFPLEFLNNISIMTKLMNHWHSIILNIARYLQFSKNTHLPQPYMDNLQPPVLKSCETPWTFYINPELFTIHLMPVNDIRFYHDPEFWISLPEWIKFNSKVTKLSEFLSGTTNQLISSSDLTEPQTSFGVSEYILSSDLLKKYIQSDSFDIKLIFESKSKFYPSVAEQKNPLLVNPNMKYDITGLYDPVTDPFSFKNPEIIKRLSFSDYSNALEHYLASQLKEQQRSIVHSKYNPQNISYMESTKFYPFDRECPEEFQYENKIPQTSVFGTQCIKSDAPISLNNQQFPTLINNNSNQIIERTTTAKKNHAAAAAYEPKRITVNTQTTYKSYSKNMTTKIPTATRPIHGNFAILRKHATVHTLSKVPRMPKNSNLKSAAASTLSVNRTINNKKHTTVPQKIIKIIGNPKEYPMVNKTFSALSPLTTAESLTNLGGPNPTIVNTEETKKFGDNNLFSHDLNISEQLISTYYTGEPPTNELQNTLNTHTSDHLLYMEEDSSNNNNNHTNHNDNDLCEQNAQTNSDNIGDLTNKPCIPLCRQQLFDYPLDTNNCTKKFEKFTVQSKAPTNSSLFGHRNSQTVNEAINNISKTDTFTLNNKVMINSDNAAAETEVTSSSVCSTQRNDVSWATVKPKKHVPKFTELYMCKSVQDLQVFRKYLLKEQKINKLVRSRITGRVLGYAFSYVSSNGVVVIPNDPELPPIEVLERMTKAERLQLKRLRYQQIIQVLQSHAEQEWKKSESYKKFQENSLESSINFVAK